ncbi:MAG: LytTR family DNA-binding domain-containing protein [Saprospiraceae bacterium]
MKTLIIDDEPAAVKRLTTLIKEIDENIEVVNGVQSVAAAVEWLGNNPPPDVIFQDIYLADGVSFEIFKQVDVTSHVIFVSEFCEHALEAFKVNAIDYLLKPLKKNELERAIGKAKTNGRTRHHRAQKHCQPSKFSFGNQADDLDFRDVAYFFTESKVTFLVTHQGKKYPIDHSLSQLECHADPRQFFRINRQFILNSRAIKEMRRCSKGRINIILSPAINLDVIVSTDRSPLFKKWLVGESING